MWSDHKLVTFQWNIKILYGEEFLLFIMTSKDDIHQTSITSHLKKYPSRDRKNTTYFHQTKHQGMESNIE